MNIMERLAKIKEHFESISMEEFEMNLEKAGMGIINPSVDMEMVLESDFNNIYDDSSSMEIRITRGYNLFRNDFGVAA